MRHGAHVLVGLLALACTPTVDPDPGVDADRDGHAARPDGDDCDDGDASVFPGAPERIGDGVDQDCDGVEACPADGDGDGHGARDTTAAGPLTCTGAGVAATADDCDDGDAATFPGATEVCDGVDRDCDGVVDDVADAPWWRADRDGDGVGDPSTRVQACTAPPLFGADTGEDCDDLDPDAYPGADEVPGDGVDQDCDGVDVCFPDHDSDGVGAGTPVPGIGLTCTGNFESTRDDDCDDDDGTSRPGAAELCGDVDHDCDGVPGDLDPDAVDAPTWFADGDGDGFGTPFEAVVACIAPAGTVADGTDCNDDLASIHPGADEVCNLFDDDCDHLVDADDTLADPPIWYADRDVDGFGDPDDARIACAAQGVYTTQDGTDCDDSLAIVNPGRTEAVGNALDEDCDGRLGCFVDADGDGRGGFDTVQAAVASCDSPGLSSNGGDCVDDDPFQVAFPWYADLDRDGWGDASDVVGACTQPIFYTDRPGDCDDGDRTTHPEAPELPGDGRDNDCDGIEQCFVDDDGDGYGAAATTPSTDVTCSGTGTSRRSDDCDDTDPTIHPLGLERIGDDVDQDCDGTELCLGDSDADGWGGLALVRVAGSACDLVGVSGAGGDCDDDDPAVHPGQPERCGPDDDNCNGLLDDDDPTLQGAPVWWQDADGDGAGDPQRPVTACVRPVGTVPTASDCADDLSAWVTDCPYTDVATGDGVACALRRDGTVACDGLVPPDGAFAQVVVDGGLACARDDVGDVTCWGAADARAAAPPIALSWLALGPTAACGLDADGAPVCWGDDTAGLVSGTPAVSGQVDLVVGADVACALDAAGTATCWGDDTCAAGPARADRLGLGAGTACSLVDGRLSCGGCGDVPVLAPGDPLLRFADVDVGPISACAVTAWGTPVCWDGALTAPVRDDLDQVDVGTEDACGLAAGTAVCWGVSGLTLPGPR